MSPESLVVASLEDVHLWFGRHHALRGVNLEVPRGCSLGLLGANGSGKSTSMRVLMGLYRAGKGKARLFGEAPGYEQQQRLGYVPEQRGLYEDVAVKSILVHFARLHGLDRKEATARAEAWLERVALAGQGHAKIPELSKGQQQCVQIGVALLHRPELLVLDEPFSGLDVHSQELLHQVLNEERAKGTTMIVSTHEIEHAERLCERVAVVSRGKIVLQEDAQTLLASRASDQVRVRMRGAPEPWGGVPGVVSWSGAGADVRLTLAPDVDSVTVLRAALDRGIVVDGFDRIQPTLRDVVLEYTAADWEDEPSAEAS